MRPKKFLFRLGVSPTDVVAAAAGTRPRLKGVRSMQPRFTTAVGSCPSPCTDRVRTGRRCWADAHQHRVLQQRPVAWRRAVDAARRDQRDGIAIGGQASVLDDPEARPQPDATIAHPGDRQAVDHVEHRLSCPLAVPVRQQLFGSDVVLRLGVQAGVARMRAVVTERRRSA